MKTKHPLVAYLIPIVVFLFATQITTAQFDIPPVPTEQTSVYDYVNLMSASQKTSLENKLIRYADSTSTQIVVVVIESTKGEDISFLGAKWGQKWGIGQADKDNGILITLATGDRRVDINTGYGIEYLVSDRDAERIINRVMIPQFKNGNYYAGLDQGADALFEYLNGNYTEDRDFSDNQEGIPIGLIFFLFFIFIIFIIALSSKKNGGGGKGNDGTKSFGSSLLDVIILSNMGRTGGFGGGSGGFGGGGSFGGGGGFGGGFGGGGFGGGGASGGW